MKKLYIFLFLLLIVAKADDVLGQLTIDEGSMRIWLVEFERDGDWPTNRKHMYLYTKIDGGAEVFPGKILQHSGQYIYPLNMFIGNVGFSPTKPLFNLNIRTYFANRYNNNRDHFRDSSLDLQPLDFDFTASNVVTKKFLLNKDNGVLHTSFKRWITYLFILKPQNTFAIKLSTTENGNTDQYIPLQAGNRNLCLDERIKIELLGDETYNTGINVAKIIYEYNFNNEQGVVGQIPNPDYCGHDEPTPCDDPGSQIPCCQPTVDEYGPLYRPLKTVLAGDGYNAEGLDLSAIIPNVLAAYKDAEGNLDLSAKDIKFRSKLILENGQETDWKEYQRYKLNFGFPDFNTTPVKTIPSCYGQENGSITFELKNNFLGKNFEDLVELGIAAFIKKGSDTISQSVSEVTVIDNQMTVTGLGEGDDYTVSLFFAGKKNNSGNNVCESSLPFQIDQLDPLALASENPIIPADPICFNGLGSAIIKLKALDGMTNVTFTLPSIGNQVVNYTSLPDETVGTELLKVFKLSDLPVGGNLAIDVSIAQERAGADNCVLQIQSPPINIVAPERVTANTPTINPSACNVGYQAGVVLQNLNGGSGSYLIRILDDGGNEVSRLESTIDEGTVQVNGTGNFKVMVNDLNAQSCDGASFDIVLSPIEPVTITDIVTIDNACANVSEGRITGKSEGTDAGVVSLYDNSGTLVDQQTNSVWSFSNLAAGIYEVKLHRSATCSDEATQIVEIKEPKAFDLSLEETPISCEGANDGILTATVDNFGIDYVTKWYKDGTSLAATELAISNLVPGNYTLEITPVTLSGTQCAPYEKHYEITEPTTVTAEVLSDAISCLDPPNNDLLIDHIAGGSGQFNIEIYKDGNLIISKNNYSAVSFLAENINPGSYEVKIMDAQRSTCSGFQNSFDIAPLEPLDMTVDVLRHNDCFGDNQGKIAVNWKGNRGIFQLLDASNNVILETTVEDNLPFDIDTLRAGTYTTVLSRSPGCNEREIQNFEITEPADMQFNFTKVDVACFGLSTGEISGTLSGGTGSYQWVMLRNGESINESGNGSDIDIVSLRDGDYTLDVTDGNNCTYQFVVSIVPLSDPMNVDMTVADISCLGEADGWINASVTGGTQPYEFQWTNDNNDILPDTDNRLEVNKPGNYFLTITDHLGCQTFDTLFVYEPPGIDFPDNINLCKDDQFKAVLSYPEDDVVYSWIADNGFSSNDSVVILNTTGNYTASVTRPNGCRYEHTFTVKMLDVEFMASFLGATWAEIGDTVYLKEVSRPKPDSITWDFSEGLIIDYDSLGDPYIYTDVPGDYTIGMYGYKDSCMSYVSQVFTFLEEGEAPNLIDDSVFGPKGVKEFKVYPNPNEGDFEIDIKLFNKEEVALFLYDVGGDEMWRVKGQDKDAYHFLPQLSNLQPGVHILLLVTPSARETIKVMVQ